MEEGRNMTREKQLSLWLKGQSVHNEERNECTPDFSCCIPSCEATLEDKLTFCDAWVERKSDIVSGMSVMFFSAMLVARGFDDVAVSACFLKE